MKENTSTQIKERLDEIRKDANLKSIRALALSMNVDDSQLSKVYNGERPITEAILKGLEVTFKAKREWVLNGLGPKYGQSADKVLLGTATIQDLLNEKEQRIKEAKDFAAKMEMHYNDMLARLAAEQENVNQAQGTIQKTIEKMESNLSQGQKNIEKQLLHSTENLGELMAKHKSDLMENTSLKKGSGLGRRKARDGDGERKGHL